MKCSGMEWDGMATCQKSQIRTTNHFGVDSPSYPSLTVTSLWPRTVDVTCNFWFPREIQRFDPGSCIHIIQGCSMYFNIFQYSSLYFYIYPNKPSKVYLSIITQGYSWISYIFLCIFCIYPLFHWSLEYITILFIFLYPSLSK